MKKTGTGLGLEGEVEKKRGVAGESLAQAG